MIYNYGLYNDIYHHLLIKLPQGKIMNIANINKLEKFVKKGDTVLFFNWSKSARKVQSKFQDIGANVFPNPTMSLFIGNRLNQLKQLDKVTKFNIERILVENNTNELKTTLTPSLKNSKKVVVKIGNEHQGNSKYLKRPNEKIITKENIVFEEYIDNARSIRILMITNNPKDIFIVEHVDSIYSDKKIEDMWIKNICPDEIVYCYEDRYKTNIKNIDLIIEDSLNIMKYLNHPYLGIDYAINEEKTAFLEVNDMIGLPDDKRVFDCAKEFFLKYLISKESDSSL